MNKIDPDHVRECYKGDPDGVFNTTLEWLIYMQEENEKLRKLLDKRNRQDLEIRTKVGELTRLLYHHAHVK